jgi:MFS family permease
VNLPKYPKNFWVISFALFFFIVSFNIIIPELNDFITELHKDGQHMKGLIIFLFSLSAALARPFSGKLADNVGRKKVMIWGAIIGTLTCLSYTLAGIQASYFSLVFFLVLRFIHGFSAGFLPTGATALVTDMLTPEQRSVGMGIWGTFISAGFGAGQMLASWITSNSSIEVLFLVATGFGFVTFIIVNQLEETLPNPKPFHKDFLKVKFVDVFEPPVIPAATVMFLSTISTGIIFVIAQEIAKFLDLNKGWFFGFYVISTILVRLFASRLSDIIGRRKTIVIGQVFLACSMIMVAFSRDVYMFTIAAIVFGLSTGVNSPTIFAWTADLSKVERRGVGAGTLFIALELGIMVGSFSTILTYDNTMSSLPQTVLFGASFCFVAIGYLIWHLIYKESKT